MTFWGVVAFCFQAVLIFALSTVLFDTLHWLLHRWGKSKVRLLRMFARWHWVHHSFLDRRLRIHPSIARKNIIYHVVPEYLTSAAGTLLFLFVFPWQPVLAALALRTWHLFDAVRAGGADINHMGMERVNGHQDLVRITPSYHAMHHIYPDNFYSSYFNIFDFVFGKSCQIAGRRFAITGASGAFGSALVRRLTKMGAEIRTLRPGIDFALGIADGAQPTLEWADVLVLSHHDANHTGFVDLIDLFTDVGRKRLTPPEVWALELKAEPDGDFSKEDLRIRAGSESAFAAQARAYYRSPDLIYRHIGRSNFTSFLGPRLMRAETAISIALFFVRRGFRYIPTPYASLAPWNYFRFRFGKPAPIAPVSRGQRKRPATTGRGTVAR